jgi:peptide/nickel transport system substrate-binding protein
LPPAEDPVSIKTRETLSSEAMATAAVRGRRLLAAALAAGGALSCGRAPVTVERPLRMALYSDLQGLDPHVTLQYQTLSALSNVFEGLTRLDAAMEVEPALAVSWENPDDVTWLFHLRPGVKFHDGRSLRAADVVYSLERARHHPQTRLGNLLVAVRNVREVDESTVEIKTERFHAVLLNKLAMPLVMPADSGDQPVGAVGTGPYRVASYRPGEGLSLDAFPDYWDGAPAVPRAEVAFVGDASERADRLLGAEFELVQELSPERVEEVRSTPGLRIEVQSGFMVIYLEGQLDAPPLDDLRVRRAISLAVDRPELVRSMAGGFGAPVGQFVAREVFGFDPRLEAPARDLPRARALLAEAGYPEGFSIALEFREGREVGALVRQLAEAGVRVEPRPQVWRELYPRMQRGEVPFYLGGMVAFSGDASSILDMKFHTIDPSRGYGELNSNRYSNPRLDREIEGSGAVFDLGQRLAVLQGCTALVAEDLPAIPLYAAQDVYGVRQAVEWTPRVDGKLLIAEMSWRPEAAAHPER